MTLRAAVGGGGAVRRAALAALALGAALASCAPPPAPAPGVDTLAGLVRAGSERRERRLAAFEASLIVRVDGRATGRVPGLIVRAAIAAPDRARLQATWLLGTALDVSARGDSLVAWAPSERAGIELAAAGESLGVHSPARFAAQALGATWSPPHEAWRDAVADSSGARVRWHDELGDMELAVDMRGRPREVAIGDSSHAIAVRYLAWSGAGADAWPSRLEIADASGWVRARITVEEPRFRSRPGNGWFALALPEDARHLELSDLRRALGRLEAGR